MAVCVLHVICTRQGESNTNASRSVVKLFGSCREKSSMIPLTVILFWPSTVGKSISTVRFANGIFILEENTTKFQNKEQSTSCQNKAKYKVQIGKTKQSTKYKSDKQPTVQSPIYSTKGNPPLPAVQRNPNPQRTRMLGFAHAPPPNHTESDKKRKTPPLGYHLVGPSTGTTRP